MQEVKNEMEGTQKCALMKKLLLWELEFNLTEDFWGTSGLLRVALHPPLPPKGKSWAIYPPRGSRTAPVT